MAASQERVPAVERTDTATAVDGRHIGDAHRNANAHFVLGGRVKGGIYGLPPSLTWLDGNGNLPFAVDFRDLYMTALERWRGSLCYGHAAVLPPAWLFLTLLARF